MSKTTLTVLCASLAAVIASTAAEAKSKPRRYVIEPATVDQWNAPGFRQEPARMVQVKPGLWISSYGCIQDEGYGRYSPCGGGRAGGR